MSEVRELHLLGIPLHPMSMAQVVEKILAWADQDEPQGYICLTAAHSLMSCRRHPRTRRAFLGSRANLTDGMPLVWFSRLRGVHGAERIYAGDLLPAIAGPAVERGLRHFFYGGAPGVAERLAAALQARYPGFRVAGTISPPFRPLTEEEDSEYVRQINASRADIVWVGLGTDKQEPWMADHRGALEAPLLISIGAAFDYLTGNKPQAPHWMQRSGLEWLFRLVTEPRRLWRRYAAYPLFALLATLELLGVRGVSESKD